MPKVTISLNIAVECEDPEEALPLLREKVRQLAEALQALAGADPEVYVTLPQIAVEDAPGWSPPPGPFAPTMVG